MSALDRVSTSMGGQRAQTVTKLLLACGVLYGVTYVIANDVIAAAVYGDYNRIDQAVSELSAEGAASRPFLVAMFAIWVPAMTAFGIGVWRSAPGNRYLRIAGAVLAAHGVIALLWLPFPMTAREDIVVGADAAANDVGHIVMSAVTGVLVLAELAFAAFGLGKRFRLFSLASAVIVVVFGAYLTGTQAPNIEQGEPTPWMGFYERAGIGAWMLWMAVLAVVLWRNLNTGEATQGSRPGVARAA